MRDDRTTAEPMRRCHRIAAAAVAPLLVAGHLALSACSEKRAIQGVHRRMSRSEVERRLVGWERTGSERFGRYQATWFQIQVFYDARGRVTMHNSYRR